MKKLFGLAAAGAAALTLSSCGGPEFIIWSFTDEIDTATNADVDSVVENFLNEYSDTYNFEYKKKKYGDNKDVERYKVKFVFVETNDYMRTILPVLDSGKNAPDVFLGELDMVQQFEEGGYMADLGAMIDADDDWNKFTTMTKEEMEADFVEYVWQGGSFDGTLKSISWQQTPGGIFFKTDMAEAVWGSEAGFPTNKSDKAAYNTAVSEWMTENKFNTLDNLLQAQEDVKMKNKNWRLFPDDQAVRHFSSGSDDAPGWLGTDGKLSEEKMIDQMEYMDLVKAMYGSSIEKSLTANAGEWTDPWYAYMGKDVEVTGSNNTKTKYQVMAYSMPTWGLEYIIKPNVETTDGELPASDGSNLVGNWGMSLGPNSYFWGGSFMQIYSNSNNKDMAYDFIKSFVFNDEFMLNRSLGDGDVYSRNSVMDKVEEQFTGHPMLGGMNHISIFREASKNINFENVTPYDRRLGDIANTYTNKYKKGENTMEQAMTGFYDEVQRTLPEVYKSGLPTTIPTRKA